jgi:hypothetical protein
VEPTRGRLLRKATGGEGPPVAPGRGGHRQSLLEEPMQKEFKFFYPVTLVDLRISDIFSPVAAAFHSHFSDFPPAKRLKKLKSAYQIGLSHS